MKDDFIRQLDGASNDYLPILPELVIKFLPFFKIN